MSIDIREATDGDLENWNSYVEQSPHGDLFHCREALQIQADHMGCQLHSLVGFKGQEPVGILPIFEIKKGPFTTAFSPPPDLRIPYQGPALLNMEKLKQRKAERRHQSFLDQCFDWVETNLNPSYTHIRLHGEYPDLRPMKWRGFETSMNYTYLVDLSPSDEDLLLSFSSDARSNIRDGREADNVSIEIGDQTAVRHILEQVRNRYESQNIAFHPSNEFLTDLYNSLPDGAIRPYVCRVDGEFVGGILAYEFGDTIYRWHGGVRIDVDVDIAVNDLLDWHVMEDAKSRGLSTYDLVGAQNQRINTYKAKFNPDLQEYYMLEKGSAVMNTAAHLYNRLRSTAGKLN